MEDCTKTTRFLKSLNAGKKRSGLFCQLKDQDLNRYIMSLANEYQKNNPDAFENPKIAPNHHGRQDGDIWVFNGNCQIDGSGNLIDIEHGQYKWLGNFTSDKTLEKLQSRICLPLRKKSLSVALKHLKTSMPGWYIFNINS
jgi:hypothetical protein